MWRHDLNTIMAAGHTSQPDIGILAKRERLARKTATATFMRGDGISLPSDLASEIVALQAEVASMEAAAAAGVQVEVSIGQQGVSGIDITARCVAGGHAALCMQAVEAFKAQLDAVIADRWPGCSPQVVAISLASGSTRKESGHDMEGARQEVVEEGVPPELARLELEPEPERGGR